MAGRGLVEEVGTEQGLRVDLGWIEMRGGGRLGAGAGGDPRDGLEVTGGRLFKWAPMQTSGAWR